MLNLEGDISPDSNRAVEVQTKPMLRNGLWLRRAALLTAMRAPLLHKNNSPHYNTTNGLFIIINEIYP